MHQKVLMKNKDTNFGSCVRIVIFTQMGRKKTLFRPMPTPSIATEMCFVNEYNDYEWCLDVRPNK